MANAWRWQLTGRAYWFTTGALAFSSALCAPLRRPESAVWNGVLTPGISLLQAREG